MLRQRLRLRATAPLLCVRQSSVAVRSVQRAVLGVQRVVRGVPHPACSMQHAAVAVQSVTSLSLVTNYSLRVLSLLV